MGERVNRKYGYQRLRVNSAAALACMITSTYCGPSTPLEALEDNCRKVCSMAHGECYGQPATSGSTRSCVKACFEDNFELAREMSDACEEDYLELRACAATWTCDDYTSFSAEDDQNCGSEWQLFSENCPEIVFNYSKSREEP